MYNTQRDNAKRVFKKEKIDNLDGLVDAVKDLTINDAKYYKSDAATVNDTQGDHTCDPKTITRTSNGNEKVMHTSNRIL